MVQTGSPGWALTLARPWSTRQLSMLPLHTDLPFYGTPPGVFVFHCLQPSSSGGENVYVDGFAAAAALTEAEPDAFDPHSSIPVVSRDATAKWHLSRRHPVIELRQESDNSRAGAGAGVGAAGAGVLVVVLVLLALSVNRGRARGLTLASAMSLTLALAMGLGLVCCTAYCVFRTTQRYGTRLDLCCLPTGTLPMLSFAPSSTTRRVRWSFPWLPVR
eukprot:m.109211 g.109211  ORF g.109211 m.109211 type:complete len:217 (-) comp15964_c0_seq3:803-1453(-)